MTSSGETSSLTTARREWRDNLFSPSRDDATTVNPSTMETELVARLRIGDANAFREAFTQHGDALYTFLLRLSGRTDIAEDLFQETWLALARSAHRLSPDTRLIAWLYTVARNAYRDQRRWSWLDLSTLLLRPTETPSPEETASSSQELARVERALARMRPADREVLLLCGIEALAPSDVAELLGLSPEAVRQRLARARRALNGELERTR